MNKMGIKGKRAKLCKKRDARKNKNKNVIALSTVGLGTDLDLDLDLENYKYIDYKVHVFDLDNTLYLHTCIKNYTENYHKKIKEFLEKLKEMGKKLYIASHNKNPNHYLDILGIRDLFDGVIFEQKDVCPSINSITEYTSKADMLYDIIKCENCNISDVVFFDDAEYNINIVNDIGIKSIKVNPLLGLQVGIF